MQLWLFYAIISWTNYNKGFNSVLHLETFFNYKWILERNKNKLRDVSDVYKYWQTWRKKKKWFSYSYFFMILFI